MVLNNIARKTISKTKSHFFLTLMIIVRTLAKMMTCFTGWHRFSGIITHMNTFLFSHIKQFCISIKHQKDMHCCNQITVVGISFWYCDLVSKSKVFCSISYSVSVLTFLILDFNWIIVFVLLSLIFDEVIIIFPYPKIFHNCIWWFNYTHMSSNKLVFCLL